MVSDVVKGLERKTVALAMLSETPVVSKTVRLALLIRVVFNPGNVVLSLIRERAGRRDAMLVEPENPLISILVSWPEMKRLRVSRPRGLALASKMAVALMSLRPGIKLRLGIVAIPMTS